MKRLAFSIVTILFTGGVIASGVTGAFFSDTETSTGNIFVAGSIDLKVDHTLQTYNGETCGGGCDKTIVSDNTVIVVENGNAPAVQLTFQHDGWTADLDGGHVGGPPNNGLNDGSYWIWAVDGVTNPLVDETFTFKKTFTWSGAATGGTLYVASDNSHIARVNGVQVGVATAAQNFSTTDEDSYTVVNIVPGLNTIEVEVKNHGLAGSNHQSNPAGLLFKLVIDGECSQSAGNWQAGGMCELWSETDLTDQQFFSFSDIKPGDSGTNVISLHVSSNDAYACLIVNNKDDKENPAQPIAPELAAGDALGIGNPLGDGELSNFLNVFTWGDTDGDGIYDGSEVSLGSGPLSSLTSIMSMDSGSGQFLTATTTKNIGLAWCAGTLTPNQGSAFGCDGNAMGNIAQTDSFSADLTAYAEQVRNNSSFRCGGVDLPQDDEGDNGESLGPAPVGLLSANGFAIIAKTAITDAGPTLSAITGNIAINPAAGSAITALSCTNVTGTLYSSGGYTGGFNSNVACAATNPVLALAVRSAMEAAYTDAATRPTPDFINFNAGNLGGQTLVPGLYKWTTGVTIPTDVTLSGDANDVWIFQIAGTLNVASGPDLVGGTKIVLAGGALAKNVFWQVAGATTLGTYSTFNGTILDLTNIAIQTGAVLNGRALAQTQVTLDANAVTVPF